jgi:quercetin dioxygenase-like cupin family protein
MEIFTRPPTAKGPAATFTGDVWVDGLYAGPTQEQARLSVVRFAPSARSHWHSHRLGQFMAHLVLMEGDRSDEPQTIWGEAVTDSDYQAPRTSTR